MRILVWLTAFVLSIQSSAGVFPIRKSVTIDASVTNIPINYSASDPASLVLTDVQGASNLKFLTSLPCEFFINTAYGDTAPPNGSAANMRELASSSSPGGFEENIYIAKSVYIRSNCSPAAAITSGKLTIEVF